MKRVVLGGALLAGLALGSGFAHQHFFSPPQPAPLGAQELLRLQLELQSLQQRLLELTQRDPSFTSVPAGRLLVGAPTPLVARFVEQGLTGFMGRLEIELPRQKLRQANAVKARTSAGVRKVGDLTLDLTLAEIHVSLSPGAPQMRSRPDGWDVKLPIALASGDGRASLRLRWKGALPSSTCDPLDLKRELTFRLVPLRWQLEGQFAVQAAGESVAAMPRFADQQVLVRVEPGEADLNAVAKLIADQSPPCRRALRSAEVREKLRALFGRGFKVTLPARLWRPIRLPAGLTRSIDVPGYGHAALAVKPIGPTLARERLWYGAEIELAQR